MPITTQIDETAKVIVCKVEGALAFDPAKAAVEEYLRHPSFVPGMNVLWDLRAATLDGFSPRDYATRMAQAFGQFGDERGVDFKLALVATSDLAFGISRQYEALTEKLPFVAHVFRDFDEAWNWLAE